MALNSIPCQVNSATSITAPGTVVNGAGVSITRNIYIVAASDTFTANGVACNPGDESISFGNNPFLVTSAVTSATVGTIWYYIQ